jgi:tetratricopeptide (TPR) repeat protein
MSYVKKTTIAIFLLIFINIFLFHTVLGIENITTEILQHDDIIASQNTTFSESTQNSSVENENILIEAQRSFDRSLDILNLVVALIGILVGVLTLIFVVGGALGFFEIHNIKKNRKKIEDDVEIADAGVNKINELYDDLKINSETYANIPKKEMEDLLPITEKSSKELIKKSNEFVSRSEFSEMLGTKLKPDDYYLRGVNLFLKSKYEEAIEAFDKAIELKHDYADPLSYKGAAHDKLGQYDEAIDAYNEAIKLKPKRAGLWFNKGVALVALGKPDQYEEAIKAYDKAIELKPDYADALYNRACLYSKKEGNEEKALSDLKQAIDSKESLKEKAKKDKHFEKLSDDKDFRELVE